MMSAVQWCSVPEKAETIKCIHGLNMHTKYKICEIIRKKEINNYINSKNKKQRKKKVVCTIQLGETTYNVLSYDTPMVKLLCLNTFLLLNEFKMS